MNLKKTTRTPRKAIIEKKVYMFVKKKLRNNKWLKELRIIDININLIFKYKTTAGVVQSVSAFASLYLYN